MEISLSDPDLTENADAAQLDAAKRISLKVKAPVTDTNLNQKVKDGFCDVYVTTSNFISQGRIQCVWFFLCMGSSRDLCFRKCRLQGDDFEFLVN
ncbi:hypothetical protein Bca52824_085580 [Brassica carinata]|uniref:Uncharacterized protein n=1 Tax=Brassica carinata TaxID=52824 RepID=A0A8X7P8J6_BRACI|nr:hypothetical protein Bca52824_085580 [Brassica carinata]